MSKKKSKTSKSTKTKPPSSPSGPTILANADTIFHMAASFDYVSSLLAFYSNMFISNAIKSNDPYPVTEAPIPPGQNKYHVPTLIPGTIASAFSVELYFKCILRNETGVNPPNNRDLVRLFGLISPPIQLLIRTTHDRIVKTDRVHTHSAVKQLRRNSLVALEVAPLEVRL